MEPECSGGGGGKISQVPYRELDFCEIWGSFSGVSEDSVYLWRDALSLAGSLGF